MSSKRFSSFQEIDTELEILSVTGKLSLYRIKNLAQNAGGETLRAGIIRVVKPLLRTLLISMAVKAIKKRFGSRGH